MTCKKRTHRLPSLTLALIFSSCISATVLAQSNQRAPQPRISVVSADKGSSSQDDPGPLTTFEEEMRAKRAIKMAEKEHQQNLSRAREISQIAKELEDSAKKTPVTWDRDTLKRIERIEKLAKKIRGEAGGEDGEITIPDRPNDLPGTFIKITHVADSLSKNVLNTPRQVVSASVIDSANVLLELIRFARTFAQ
jgi:hypothetical protein